MTEEIAIAVVKKRMQERGYAEEDYCISYKQFVLQGEEVLEIGAYGAEWYMLTKEVDSVKITSDMGMYDLTSILTNELLYEHEGNIRIENYSSDMVYVPMIQVTPMN